MKFYDKVITTEKHGHFHLLNRHITWAELFFTAIGTMLGIGILALLTDLTALVFLVPPFGASAVLLYAAPTVALAQPRNVIGGHFISAFMGVLIHQIFGNPWWAVTLAVTLAILSMAITDTLHPPGGATALVAMISENISWSFIFFPILTGAIIMVVISILVNRFSEERDYPTKKY